MDQKKGKPQTRFLLNKNQTPGVCTCIFEANQATGSLVEGRPQAVLCTCFEHEVHVYLYANGNHMVTHASQNNYKTVQHSLNVQKSVALNKYRPYIVAAFVVRF